VSIALRLVDGTYQTFVLPVVLVSKERAGESQREPEREKEKWNERK
jgi:hypothetical protein